jgi:hypothetical protein
MSLVTVLCCYKNVQLIHMIVRNYTGVHELEAQPILLQKASYKHNLTGNKYYWTLLSYSNNTHNMRFQSLWNVFPSKESPHN